MTTLLAALALSLAPQAEPATGEFTVPVAELQFTDKEPSWGASAWMASPVGATLVPRVTIDGYVANVSVEDVTHSMLPFRAIRGGDLALEGPEPEGELTGTLWLPNFGSTALEPFAFTIPADAAAPDDLSFRVARASWYSTLAGTGVPGAPWFRRRARAYGDRLEDLPPIPQIHGRNSGESYAMFTGGRALAENLALDDVINVTSDDVVERVAIADIEGVRVPEAEWTRIVVRPGLELDPLAHLIPHDQHAVFFPSFDALIEVADGLEREAAPFVMLADGAGRYERVRERYQEQMCLSLDALTRRFGSKIVKSAALTGSDAYLRTGSDVALILEGDPAALVAMMNARMEAAAAKHDVEVQSANVAGRDVRFVRTAHRELSCYVAAFEDAAVITNSRVQLERLIETENDTVEDLAGLDEYRVFRDRYPIGAEDEDAFVMVSDATIRRWSGPRWRIATARRTRAAAVLADADAYRVAANFDMPNAAAPADRMPVTGGGDLDLGGEMATDSVYGRLTFLTPIAELELTHVAPAEKNGYEDWRRGYESMWGRSFDPLGVKVSVHDDGLDVDLTLVPLVMRTDYRMLIDLAGDALLDVNAGDPHEGSLVHWVCALDRESRTWRDFERFLRSVDGATLDWMGDDIAIWIDDDAEYLERVRETDDFEMFTQEMLPGLPVAIRFSITDAEACRATIEAIGDMIGDDVVQFTRETHRDVEYGLMTSDASLGFDETPTLHWVAVEDALVMTFSKKVIHGVIDRSIDGNDTEAHWAGASTAIAVGEVFDDAAAVEMIDLAAREQMRARSWANIPILNEWHHAGATDPVAFHEREWGVRLVCPGGGEYVWDAENGTMSSTAYGSPSAPKDGPSLPASLRALKDIDLSLAFERWDVAPAEAREGERRLQASDRGLRARVRLRR